MLTIRNTRTDKRKCLAVAKGAIIKDIKLITSTMLGLMIISILIHGSKTYIEAGLVKSLP
jgi:hypothetical protein